MRYGLLRFGLVALCVCFGVVPRAGAQTQSKVVRCSSDDGGRHVCAVDARGGVELARQVSGSPCTRDYSWGYDNRGIWVDHGCRADFTVYPANSWGGNTNANVQTITCSANSDDKLRCKTDTSKGVTFVRQISGSPCNEGQTWGWDGSGIWVSHGCRAVFALGSSSSAGIPETIKCSSDDEHWHFCPADTHGGVRVSRQISEAACTQGTSWGYDDRGIWVDRGCRAEFTTGGIAAQAIRCSSDDGERHICPTDTRGGIQLSRQISGSPCNQGYSWGYDASGIWVDHGCRAEFTVGSYNATYASKAEISCTSDEGGRHFCWTGPHRNIDMEQQISDAPCVPGTSWGEDTNGVWVDQGCRAIFRVQY